jgi:hypothetical protein
MANDLPDFLSMSGWQRSDDEHPPGEGIPSYRVVYKTLKTYLPPVEMTWPNLVLRTGHDDVDRGGVRLGEAMQARREHRWVLPQPGDVEIDGQVMTFRPRATKDFEFRAWQEDVGGVFFVELILDTTEESPNRRMAEGRRRLGYLKTLIELSFGSRVLGVLLTEELGEVFPDGHFNRNLHSEQVGNEWQMDLAAIMPEQVKEWARHPLGTLSTRTPDDRERLSLACDWYWRSTQTADLVTEYLELWFVVEAVAMPDTTNIRPVREQLAAAFGGGQSDWEEVVGRHFGRRSRLVHSQVRREIEEADVEGLRELVQALLELEFGIENIERANRLRALAGLRTS